MSVRLGKCGVCNKQGVELEEHHVVEYLDEQKRTPKIFLCNECHEIHEKYRNYLKNDCKIDIDIRDRMRNHLN